ncbi:cellulase (glycosyl hydrolase family 5) [Motilibacter rhizosphaerae]|uniref:Cellulase (Glycosyl hydrolase family 5) n=1 Tax=Motilibacter rhizosphaerae TaxID=598652 RepID=A0A4Q7NQB1_9ACTN|nr:glycosyl hydrolase [Motilibacter rhizosphaerae]RZS87312.1 cellulase (glycosyl hydrolase family 5) [Motilibacter rhizosphaerae]
MLTPAGTLGTRLRLLALSAAAVALVLPATPAGATDLATTASCAVKPTTVTKPTVKKPAAKKPTVKKPAAKKPTAKKPAAKKPTAKKPATKKPAATKPSVVKRSVVAHVAKAPVATKAVTKKPLPKPLAKKPLVKKPLVKKPLVKKPLVKKPVTKAPVAPRTSACPLPVIPVVAGALAAQPGPVSAPVDRPLVPSVQPLGRTLASYFGIHGAPDGSAQRGFGSVRLWDTGTTWNDLEPAQGVWNWAPLDAAVADAQARGYSPMLVLGQTPTWASSNPSAPGYGDVAGASVPPADLGQWTAYVSAVASRYKGRIAGYEMWNEPNFVGDYWHGTEQQLATLTSLAHDAVKAADPKALVISPGFATRTRGQQGWLFRYLDAVDASDLDVVSLHLYPMPQQTPEVAAAQLQSVVDALRSRGISKPVWNTEVNYGVTGGTADAVPVPDPMGGAYIVRTLLADRAAGIDRVFWYRWGVSRILGIGVYGDASGLTPAAQAWFHVAGWLTHSVLVGCTTQGEVKACTLRPDGGGWAQVLWSTGGDHTLRAPAATTGTVGIDGSTASVAPGAPVTVTGVPVLVAGGGAHLGTLATELPN